MRGVTPADLLNKRERNTMRVRLAIKVGMSGLAIGVLRMRVDKLPVVTLERIEAMGIGVIVGPE